MNKNKIQLDAFATASTLLWIIKLNIPVIPFISLIYFLFRSFELREINPNKFKYIFTIGSLSVVYITFHSILGDIDAIKSFARIVYPVLLSCLIFFVINEYKKNQFKIFIQSIFWIINLIAIIDFIKFISLPRYLIIAPFEPYLGKTSTSLYVDGNWMGAILISFEFISICIKNAEGNFSRLIRYFLIYLSGSRSAISTLIFFKIYEMIKYFIIKFTEFKIYKLNTKNNFSDKIWAIFNTRIFSFFVFGFFLILLPFLLNFLFPAESIDLADNVVGFSVYDGSFRTKLSLINYAIESLNNTFILIFGNGPQVYTIKGTYVSHSFIGSLPELGLLGGFIIMFPFILFVFNLRNYCLIYLCILIFNFSFSFYPYAYMTPIYALILVLSYKFRSRKLSKGEVIKI